MEMIRTGQRGRKRNRLHSDICNKRKAKRRRGEIIWRG